MLDRAGVYGVIVGTRVLGPDWVRLDCVDLHTLLLEHLPQEALRRAYIQHRRAADPANELSDLLVATLSVAVKCVVQDIVSIIR